VIDGIWVALGTFNHLSDGEVEAVALRVVRKIQGPRARFLDQP